jgi:hypothetical protein
MVEEGPEEQASHTMEGVMRSPIGNSSAANLTDRRVPAPQRRFVIGGLGSLLPSVLTFLALDAVAILPTVTGWVVVGVLLKGLGYFVVGGFWAGVHSGERNPRTLAQLGMLAPVMIATLISGNVAKAAPLASFVSVAHAQVEEAELPQPFTLPESRSEQVWRGFTGNEPTQVWFVIASSHRTLDEARSAARGFNEQGLRARGFEASVYKPSGGYPSYAVVIGANLTLREAEDLRDRAITAGLPPTTQVWRPTS